MPSDSTARLRERGIQVTAQRLAVLRALKEQGRGFVWARSLERYVWLGEGAPAGEAEADDAERPAAEGSAEAATALDQKRIW